MRDCNPVCVCSCFAFPLVAAKGKALHSRYYSLLISYGVARRNLVARSVPMNLRDVDITL